MALVKRFFAYTHAHRVNHAIPLFFFRYVCVYVRTVVEAPDDKNVAIGRAWRWWCAFNALIRNDKNATQRADDVKLDQATLIDEPVSGATASVPCRLSFHVMPSNYYHHHQPASQARTKASNKTSPFQKRNFHNFVQTNTYSRTSIIQSYRDSSILI